MLSTATFCFIFIGACFLSALIVYFLNQRASPLRKAWNVYGAMYALHFLLFMGLVLTLPAAYPSYVPKQDRTDELQSLEDLKRELRHQRDDIDDLKNNLHATTETLHWALFLLALFAPMLYYNMFKYNLRIEELSGKRMGSFD